MSDPPSPRPRVLFVDDDPTLTRNLHVVLRKAPFEILTANGGEEALEILEAGSVDVVVSDERMPGMSGSALLTRVREAHPDVHRIILTGQASLEATIEAINGAGVFRYLSKPCLPSELVSAIQDALAMRTKGPAGARLFEETSQGQGSDLDRALDRLWVAFQPILCSKRRQLFGYEALIRSEDEVLQTPLDLLGTAERLDRIVDLETRIWELAAQCLDAAPVDHLVYLVNIHPASLSSCELFEPDNPLQRHAERVFLEVTERATLDGVSDLGEKLTLLRRRGYRIALDDMGAGYAGLSSFAALQPDLVKFDRSLVDHIQDSPIQSKLVGSITQLSKELGILSLAEGVETEAERDHVSALGCDLVQGYWFGRPEKPFNPGRW